MDIETPDGLLKVPLEPFDYLDVPAKKLVFEVKVGKVMEDGLVALVASPTGQGFTSHLFPPTPPPGNELVEFGMAYEPTDGGQGFQVVFKKTRKKS
jgi:hypothetical protein